MSTRRPPYRCFLLVLFLSACGQMGPLYLPDHPSPIHVSAFSQSNTH